MEVEELFPGLPEEKTALPKPYTERAGRAAEWLHANALPILGISLSICLAI